MKTKSIILSGLLLVSLGVATTSCEDMLSVEDELHTKNLAPQDTVYQMMGIINRMQSLVDRTVVLGELRADLVDLDLTVAKTSLQEVMANNISINNEYNAIADYYAVINSCNIYLGYVDSLFKSHNKYHYEKEIQSVKVFRAWTYLEMAKTYGKVPFVLEPVTTSGRADQIVADKSMLADMGEICTYFINDLLPYANRGVDIELPNYGSINDFASSTFFIPLRLMLAELYLWRGSFNQSKDDYLQACIFYHDYFCTPDREITTGISSSKWNNFRFQNVNDDYSVKDEICIIPMDTCAYDGTWSELYGMFNSQFENNYYVPVVPSKRVRELSQEQIYCYYFEEMGNRDTIYSSDKEEWEDSLYMGDLRLGTNYQTIQVSDRYTDRFSKDRQGILKYGTTPSRNPGPDKKITSYRVYRSNIAWLHFAEALNRAGFPQTAFVILKYGIDPETVFDFVTSTERMELNNVETRFLGSLGSWDYNAFITRFSSYAYDSQGQSKINTQGVHARGSGDASYNDLYDLPYNEADSANWAQYRLYKAKYDSLSAVYNKDYQTRKKAYMTEEEFDNYSGYKFLTYDENDSLRYARYVYVDADDSINYENMLAGLNKYDDYSIYEREAYVNSKDYFMKAVDKMILDEQALEGMFEGTRFYDLMRYAMYHGDKDFIANQVARRKGDANYDSRADVLRGGNWYLPLP